VNSCSSIPRRGLPALLFPAPALAQARLPAIITTTAMLADAVRALAGPAARVESLMGEGVDPHLFRPTRADTAKLLAADLVVLNGHRLEGRMEEVLARLAAAGRRVLAMAEALPRAELRSHPEYPDAADPHVWMDPTLWGEAAGSVLEPLARLAPDVREGMADALARFRARCERLDAYAREAMATVPDNARVLVTAHDAFSYFGRRYGLAIESIQGLSTEAEANLAAIESLVAKLVERRVPAVFAETSVPDRAVRALIEGAGARGQRVALGGNLYSDAMGRPGTYEGTYEGMMDHNITTIVRALGGQVPARGLNGRLVA